MPTPAELAPRQQVQTDPASLPGRNRELPSRLGEPAGLTIDVTGYTVDDRMPVQLKSALAAITAPYVGAGKSYADLIGAAEDVTRFLNRELGWYLGYAYIPEQVADGGRIRIEVVEGRLDRIELMCTDGGAPKDGDCPQGKDPAADRWNVPISRATIENYLAALRPGEVLLERDIERVVFLINDLHGVLVRFDVKPGGIPGTASLEVRPSLDPDRARKVDADLNGSRFLGSARVGGLWSASSLAGRGDVLTLNGLASTNGGLTFALASYTMPIGRSGLKFGASVSYVSYKLDPVEFPLGVHGTTVDETAYLLYPVIRSRNLNLFVVGSLDHKDFSDLRDLAGTNDKRSIDSFKLGLTGDIRDNLFSGGINTYNLELTSGKVRYRSGVPGSLDDAPAYTKLSLSFNRLQNLMTQRLLLYASAQAQFAFENLDTSEQFRLGGPDGLRAFAPGEGTGDGGVVGTVELRLVPPEEWVGRYSRESVIGLFVDAGSVKYRQNTARQAANFVNSASFSDAGLTLSWARRNEYALRLSIAKPISGTPKSDPKVRDPRLYGQFSKFF